MAAKLFLWTTRVLPMISGGEWWIRLWDFPRLQLAWALLVPLALLAVHA